MWLIGPGVRRRVEPHELCEIVLLECRAHVARRFGFDNVLPVLGWDECAAGLEPTADWISMIAFNRVTPQVAMHYAGFYGKEMEP